MSKREVKLFKSGSFHAQKIETKEKNTILIPLPVTKRTINATKQHKTMRLIFVNEAPKIFQFKLVKLHVRELSIKPKLTYIKKPSRVVMAIRNAALTSMLSSCILRSHLNKIRRNCWNFKTNRIRYIISPISTKNISQEKKLLLKKKKNFEPKLCDTRLKLNWIKK
jgi:oxalate decarboxylase/phosphoglucose isomerase-like protein (cupin superfamily)